MGTFNNSKNYPKQEREFSATDCRIVSELSGYSVMYVRQCLLYGHRDNYKIKKIASELKEFKARVKQL